MGHGLARRPMLVLDAIRGAPPSLRIPAAACLLLVLPGGTILSAVLQRHLLEASQTAQHLVEFNVGEAFGLAASGALILADRRGRIPLTGCDIAILLLSALAWLVPEAHGIYLAMTLAGLWFGFGRRSDRQLAGLGEIWLALSVYELWGKLLFKLVYQTIELVEVGLIYRVGRLFYGGLGMAGASLSVREDWSIVILEGCSSFHNLSLTVLIWICILKIAGGPAGAAALRALGVSACLVVAINVARILAMLPSREAYLFWHDGTGASLVALSSVAAAILPVALCVEAGACRRNPRS